MGIFDALTGAPAVNAASQNTNILGQTQQNILGANNNNLTRANDILSMGYGGANANLGTGYGTSTGAINAGANNALGYLGQGTNSAIGALTANGGAYAPLSALAQNYGQGASLYADSLGINGPEGTARARAAFTAAPGYDYTLNQGIDAINRRANAGGMLQGGNANRDAIAFATNLANQGYTNWQNNLGSFNPLQLSATQGAAAGNQANNQAIASLYNAQGRDQANIATGQGQNLSNLAQQYYGGLASSDIGRATAQGNNVNAYNQLGVNSILNLTPQMTQQNTNAANAETQGSANALNLAQNIAKLAVGAAGGGLGGGFGAGLGGGSFGGIGGNLGPSGFTDPSMWNRSLPANGFNFG